MTDLLSVAVGSVAFWLAVAAVVALVAWRVALPTSFWLVLGFPFAAVRVRMKWAEIADGCGLTKRKNRLLRRNGVTRLIVPRLSRIHPTRYGWIARLKLLPGQEPGDVRARVEKLRHAFRASGVRLRAEGNGWVQIAVLKREPLGVVDLPRKRSLDDPDALVILVGRVEDGSVFAINFRLVPHWLVMGITRAGKSIFLNAVVMALAPLPVALIGIDLKGGLSLARYESRLSLFVTTREEAADAIDALLQIMALRMGHLRVLDVENIWEIDDLALRPVPVIVLVDEVARLYRIASKDAEEKALVARISTGLTTLAEQGAAAGIHLMIAGQRIGPDLGPGVTALRAELAGRICFQVADADTGRMALGDTAPDAIEAVQQFGSGRKGMCVIAGDGPWKRARPAHTTKGEAKRAAAQHAHLTPSWESLQTTAAPGASIVSVD